MILFVLLGLQVPAAQAPTVPASPVARLTVSGARSVVAGDSVKLSAHALDASGKDVPEARIRYFAAGGMFEGKVDSLGMVHGGSVGTIPVAVVAIVPGAKPKIERVEIRIVAGPATRVEIAPKGMRLAAGQRIRAAARAFSSSGDERFGDRIEWTSSAPGVATVTDGIVSAVGAGTARLTATAGGASESATVTVLPNTIAQVRITPSSPEARQGDVLRFTATPLDAAGKAIAGLTPSWSFAPGEGSIDPDGAFVGYLAKDYVVSASFGTRTAETVARLKPRDVRRKTTVVGHLARGEMWPSEVWVHPDGKHAYLGTVLGGDRIYAVDVSDPSKPVITDSIVANARSINDVMSTADGKWLVFTREGAADRKNGIVIASLADPAHPKAVADFTENVTSGVHSAFVYTQPKYGTHVYLTNDGTGALDVVDINDPLHPKWTGEWRTARGDAGRSLHDVDVQDGIAYVSYWNDGLVMLDIGNGIKGGTPSAPKLISQLKYDLNSMYKEAEAQYGAGFIRGTHTAWRSKNYVFVGDEVFPPPSAQGFDLANIRAYGRLQVIDVSDIEHPKSVAWYEPENGGVHNVWVAGDTLYMGAYNAGFHAFDVSGELRGDLRTQGREIAQVQPAAADAKVPNKAFTWGVVVKNGLAYVNDMYSGLWIVRIEPKALTP
ncbi:MAG: hypothetical protein ABJD07_12075 [Gemmatimonadaceae bacterium]